MSFSRNGISVGSAVLHNSSVYTNSKHATCDIARGRIDALCASKNIARIINEITAVLRLPFLSYVEVCCLQNNFSYDNQYAERLSEQDIYELMEDRLRFGGCYFVRGQWKRAEHHSNKTQYKVGLPQFQTVSVYIIVECSMYDTSSVPISLV